MTGKMQILSSGTRYAEEFAVGADKQPHRKGCLRESSDAEFKESMLAFDTG